MPISVLLTLNGLREEKSGIDRGSQSDGSLNVRAQVGDDVLLDVRFTVSGRSVEPGRDGQGDHTVEGRRGGRLVEENHGCVSAARREGVSGLKIVDHVMHPVQGVVRVAAMPQTQAYGVTRAMPSLQGPFRSGTNPMCQGDTP